MINEKNGLHIHDRSDEPEDIKCWTCEHEVIRSKLIPCSNCSFPLYDDYTTLACRHPVWLAVAVGPDQYRRICPICWQVSGISNLSYVTNRNDTSFIISAFNINIFQKIIDDEVIGDIFSISPNERNEFLIKCNQKRREKWRDEYDEYIKNSYEWKAKSLKVRKRDNYKCQHCGSSGKHIWLNVHHKSYRYIPYDPEWILITLCRKCHKEEHDRINERKKNVGIYSRY